MLLSLSVYSRRIESQRQPLQAIQKSFVAELLYSRRKIFIKGRGKITLNIIIILNLILPIMGSLQPVDEKIRNFSSILDRAILATDSGSQAGSAFRTKEQELPSVPRKIEQKDYDLSGLARLIKKNGRLLYRIMERIPQNHGVGGSRVSQLTTSNADRERATKSESIHSFFASENSEVKSPKERTTSTKNFSSVKFIVRKRRDAGDRRRKRLYNKAGRYILQIHPDGRVDGTLDSRSPLGIMNMHIVSMGKIRIQSEATGLFLSMTPSGRLYGSVVYDPRYGAFEERLTRNSLTTYSMTTRKGKAFVGLSKHGRAKKGTRINDYHAATHFLPLDIK